MATPAPNYNIQYDEQGRPFTQIGGTGARSYISPVAMGTGTRPTGGGGILKKGWQWSTKKGGWEQPTDWGNVATMGVAGLAGAAALPALLGGIGGGAGAGAGAGLSEATIPTALGVPGSALPGVGVGAAGTAGGSMGAGKILSRLAPILSRAAGNQAESKQLGAQQQLSRDRLAQDQYAMDTELPGKRLSTGVRASRVTNAQPVQFMRGPGGGSESRFRATGGYANPDLVSLEARQLGVDVLADMVRQQRGPGAPGPTPAPRSSVGDKLLGGAAFGVSALDAAGIDPFKWF